MSKVFNIVATSLALIGHFIANPIEHAERRRVPRAILANLAALSQPIAMPKPRHVGEHCFAFDLPGTVVDDAVAASTLILFEDTKSLARRHHRALPEIAKVGRGAYCHLRGKIFFSTSDNTSPLTNGRRYWAMHSLTGDAAAFSRVAAWHKSTAKTGAARLAELMTLLCPAHFGYETAGGAGPDVVLNGVRLAIDRDAKLALSADTVAVERFPGSTTRWSVELRNLRDTEPDAPTLLLRAIVDLAPEAEFMVPRLDIEGPNGFSLGFAFDAATGISIAMTRPRLLAEALRASFSEDEGWRRWVASVFDLLSGSLEAGGLGLALDLDARSVFEAMLSRDGSGDRYEFSLRPSGSSRGATLRRVPIDHD
ncbi:MAG TPA: hypothetical protein VMT54_14665 [Candidatus Cybelea sp.]|nr:hypothetical protein [Candidatus Cybelea sp.]